jgi:hypothetical protein
MLSITESFGKMKINMKKRNKSDRYESDRCESEIVNLFKSIKIVDGDDEEMGDDEKEMGDDDDDSTIQNKEEEEKYKNLIESWNMINIDNTEDVDFQDREKEIHGYETMYEGFYNSNDEFDEFDYWTSENDFNDNE